MAGKKTDDKLPKLDEWKAPWETDKDGNELAAEDQNVDKDQLKRYLHGLLSDKQRLRGQLDTSTEQVTELERKVNEASTPEKIKELQDAVTAAKKERDEAKGGSALETLKLRVALRKGLTEKQAARLVGSDEDELLADADELVASFGGTGTADEGEEDGALKRAPKRPRNPVDRVDDNGPPKEIDYDKLVAEKLSR